MAVVTYVPTRLGEDWWEDLPVPTAGDDGKAVTYDHGTGAFVYAAAGGGTPPGSTTQVIFNDAGAYGADAGLTYAKATDRLTVAGGLVAGDISPPSDSATAFSVWNAARSSRVVTVDTTNQKLILQNNKNLEFGTSGRTPYIKANSNTLLEFGDNVSGKFFEYSVASESLIGTHMKSLRFPIDGNLTLLGDVSKDFVKVQGAGHVFLLLNHYGTFGITYNGGSNVLSVGSSGETAIGGSHTATAIVDIAASSTARASSRQRAGTAPTTPNDGDAWNDGNAYGIMVNGTNAVNTDGGLSVWMQSSLQARNVGRLLWQYTDKTDASRVTKGALTAYYQSTERKAIHWSADVNGPLLSFGAVTTPIATPVLATGAGATADNIIQVLQNLGLVKQS